MTNKLSRITFTSFLQLEHEVGKCFFLCFPVHVKESKRSIKTITKSFEFHQELKTICLGYLDQIGPNFKQEGRTCIRVPNFR